MVGTGLQLGRLTHLADKGVLKIKKVDQDLIGPVKSRLDELRLNMAPKNEGRLYE